MSVSCSKKNFIKNNPKPTNRLKYIATHFINQRWDEEKFKEEILKLLQKHQEFLQERNENNQYIHRSLRSALFGIKLALPNLFTFQKYKSSNIPNTTNHIDGGINPKIKRLVNDHRGMNKNRRNILISNLLVNLGKRG